MLGYRWASERLNVWQVMDAFGLISERHLGLIMPDEHGGQDILERTLLDEVVPGLDVETILRIASAAEPLGAEAVTPAGLPDGAGLKIGYFKDPRCATGTSGSCSRATTCSTT